MSFLPGGVGNRDILPQKWRSVKEEEAEEEFRIVHEEEEEWRVDRERPLAFVFYSSNCKSDVGTLQIRQMMEGRRRRIL